MSAAEYASTAVSGHGATLEVGDGASPEVFTAVLMVKNIKFGDMSTSEIDVSHLLSPQNHKERIPGQRDTGGIDFEFNWLPTDQTQSNDSTPGGLVYLQRTRAIRNWRVVMPQFGVSPDLAWTVRGYLSKFNPGSVDNNQAMAGTATIQPAVDTAADLP